MHVVYTLSLFLISLFCCCSLSRYKKVPRERYSMGMSIGEWEPQHCQQSCRLYSQSGQHGSVYWRVGASALSAVLSSLQPNRSAWVCLLESGSLSSPVPLQPERSAWGRLLKSGSISRTVMSTARQVSMCLSVGEWEHQPYCHVYSQTGQHGSVYWRAGSSVVLLSSLQPDRSAWGRLLKSGSISRTVMSTARQVSMGLSVGEWEHQPYCHVYSQTGQHGSVCWRVGASAVLSSLLEGG
jgi:hypothetical protein